VFVSFVSGVNILAKSASSSNYSALFSDIDPLSENPNIENNIGIYQVTLQNNTIQNDAVKSPPVAPEVLLNNATKTKAIFAVAAQLPTNTITTNGQCYISTSLPFTDRTTQLNQVTDQNNPQLIYVKAKSDSLIEGEHACVVTHEYFFPYTPLDNFVATKTIIIQDFTPGFNATSSAILYENPKDKTESTEGEVGIKLIQKPSDTAPIVVDLVSQTPDICRLLTNTLTFTQTNFDTKQSIQVTAIKDGIYQPDSRDCIIKANFSSDEGDFVDLQTKRTSGFIPVRYKLAAQEYNSLNYNIVIKVLDADFAPQSSTQNSVFQLAKTGFSNPYIWVSLIILLVVLLISLIRVNFKKNRSQN
jgi:hypothetical protein